MNGERSAALLNTRRRTSLLAWALAISACGVESPGGQLAEPCDGCIEVVGQLGQSLKYVDALDAADARGRLIRASIAKDRSFRIFMRPDEPYRIRTLFEDGSIDLVRMVAEHRTFADFVTADGPNDSVDIGTMEDMDLIPQPEDVEPERIAITQCEPDLSDCEFITSDVNVAEGDQLDLDTLTEGCVGRVGFDLAFIADGEAGPSPRQLNRFGGMTINDRTFPSDLTISLVNLTTRRRLDRVRVHLGEESDLRAGIFSQRLTDADAQEVDACANVEDPQFGERDPDNIPEDGEGYCPGDNTRRSGEDSDEPRGGLPDDTNGDEGGEGAGGDDSSGDDASGEGTTGDSGSSSSGDSGAGSADDL